MKTTPHFPISPEDLHLLKYSATLSPDDPRALPCKAQYVIQLYSRSRGEEELRTD